MFAAALFFSAPTLNKTNAATNLNNQSQPPQKVQAAEVAKETVTTTVKAEEQAPEPVPESQQPVTSGSCETELSKYDWSQTVALAVATAESGLDPGTVNYNPSTYDYSVGCFQVNIWGNNALTRPSEAELKNPVVNVATAYKIYASNGHSFIGQWGVCKGKVACY